MKKFAVLVLCSMAAAGCGSSSAVTAAFPPAALCSASPAGQAPAAAAGAGFTELYVPVSVGVSYVLPFDDLLTDAVGVDIAYTWRKDYHWDVEVSAGYVRYVWENGATKTQTFPVMAVVRYSNLMLSGASWYTGAGVGYSLNDPVDLENSLAAKVTAGIVQPMNSDRVLAGLEVSYYYSKADRKWGGDTLDLSSLQARLSFIYNF